MATASHTSGSSNKLRKAAESCTNLLGVSTALPTPTGLPELLTIAEVAAATKLSPKTIRRRCADSTLRWRRVGPRVIRIERDSIGALLGN